MRSLVAALMLIALAGCAQTTPTGIVRGQVFAAPTCPVERIDVPCPPRAVAGAEVRALDANTVIATTKTDAAGSFTLHLPYGSHTVEAINPGGYRSTATKTVSVGSTPVAIELTVDSGIR